MPDEERELGVRLEAQRGISSAERKRLGEYIKAGKVGRGGRVLVEAISLMKSVFGSPRGWIIPFELSGPTLVRVDRSHEWVYNEGRKNFVVWRLVLIY